MSYRHNRGQEGLPTLRAELRTSVECGDGDEGAAARRDGERSRPGFGLTVEPPTPIRRNLSQRRIIASNLHRSKCQEQVRRLKLRRSLMYTGSDVETAMRCKTLFDARRLHLKEAV